MFTCKYDEAVDLVGNGRYNVLLLTVCSIISNAVALDMFSFGVISEVAACDLHLTMAQRGILASTPFAGEYSGGTLYEFFSFVFSYPVVPILIRFIVSCKRRSLGTHWSNKAIRESNVCTLAGLLFSHVWGYVADTGGRRPSLVCSTAVGFACAALSSFSPTWYIMAVLKFIGCSFSVAAFTLTITLLGECTGAERRARYLQIMNGFNLASEIVIFALSYLLLKLEFAFSIPWLGIVYRPWRLLVLILALPLGVGAVAMLYFHESPKFLADRGRIEEALEVLRDIYERNGGRRADCQVDALSTDCTSKVRSNSFWRSVSEQTVPIFKPPLLWRTLQLYYLFAVITSTNNVFLMWFPMIVNSLFFSLDTDRVRDYAGFCQIIVDDIKIDNSANATVLVPCKDRLADNTVAAGVGAAIFFTVLAFITSKVASRRKLLLLIVFFVTGISGMLIDLVKIPMVSLTFYVLLQLPTVCIGTTASYFMDLYPTSCRGMVSSLGFMVARLVSFASVNLIGALIVHYCDVIFYLWSTFVFSGIFVGLFLPKDVAAQKAE